MHQSEIIESLIGQRWGLFIGGKVVKASDDGTFKIFSPANGENIATVSQATKTDIDKAVKISHDSFKEWSKVNGYDRELIIKKATAHVRTQADRIGYLMALEQGKPFNQSRSEVISSCDLIDYFASEAVRIEGYTNVTEKNSYRSWVIYQPVGVCALITPWNYPLALLSWKLGPALAAGCTAVLKPSELTPLSPMAFCMGLVEGGIPAGVISVLRGGGSVAETLINHSLVSKIAMTGSTPTGKKIMQSAGSALKKVSLELGGHCPAIVCADADIENAAAAIVYKGFRNMGQSCSTVNRVYVHKSLHDPLIKKIKELTEKLKIGDGISDGAVDLGPMTSKAALEKVADHVSDAVAKGATVVTGGKAPQGKEYSRGYFYMPTVLSNVTSDMKLMKEETFGPVVPVEPFESIEEAIRKANDTNYGLVAYLFTKDFKTTIQLSEELEAGTVCVNNAAVNTGYGPYEGWKESGFGIELSRKSIFEYLHSKHIKVQLV